MFTGIIEQQAKVEEIVKDQSNVHFRLSSLFQNELKVDQSVAHNGVCLTVTKIDNNGYWVTAIDETLQRTNLNHWHVNDLVNVERCMPAHGRFDGHIVQGHVDQIGTCVAIEEAGGSWHYTFEYDSALNNITIEKGSITVNGVSLTVVNSKANQFSVAIIPYTYEHTNFNAFQIGTVINLEFDVIGKYVSRLYNPQ